MKAIYSTEPKSENLIKWKKIVNPYVAVDRFHKTTKEMPVFEIILPIPDVESKLLRIVTQLESGAIEVTDFVKLIRALAKGELLSCLYPTVTNEALLKLVCDNFNIGAERLMLRTREIDIVLPRHAYYFLLRRYTKMSYKEIGNSLGLMQDHSTIIHCIKVCDNAISTNDPFGQKLKGLLNQLP